MLRPSNSNLVGFDNHSVVIITQYQRLAPTSGQHHCQTNDRNALGRMAHVYHGVEAGQGRRLVRSVFVLVAGCGVVFSFFGFVSLTTTMTCVPTPHLKTDRPKITL